MLDWNRPKRLILIFVALALLGLLSLIVLREPAGAICVYGLQFVVTLAALFCVAGVLRFSIATLMIADVFYCYFTYIEKIEPGAVLIPFLLTSFLYAVSKVAAIIFLLRKVDTSHSLWKDRGVLQNLGNRILFWVPTLLILIPTISNILWPLWIKLKDQGTSLGLMSVGITLLTSFFLFHASIRLLVCARDLRGAMVAFGFLCLSITEWGIQFEVMSYEDLRFSFYDVTWFLGILCISFGLILMSGVPWGRVVYVGRESLIQNYRIFMVSILLLPLVFISFIFSENLERVIFFAMANLGGFLLILWTSIILERGIIRFSQQVERALQNPSESLSEEGHQLPQELRETFWAVADRLLRDERTRLQVQLESALRMSNLAAEVAHDIRSPVAALEMVTAGLENLPEDSRSLLKNISFRIRNIADELMKNYRVTEDGRNSSLDSSVDLVRLVRQVYQEKCHQYASHEGLSLKLEVSETSIFRPIDSIEFMRVISNLIDNAVEATEGAVRLVELKCLARGEGFWFEIADNGKGISQNHISNLGKRGFTFGKLKGSGLGLHFVYKSVEKWNWKLSVESVVGRGTTFRILG